MDFSTVDTIALAFNNTALQFWHFATEGGEAYRVTVTPADGMMDYFAWIYEGSDCADLVLWALQFGGHGTLSAIVNTRNDGFIEVRGSLPFAGPTSGAFSLHVEKLPMITGTIIQFGADV